jgi:serine/threonine protein kinase
VYKALNLNTSQTVAVKQLQLRGLSDAEITQLMQEVELLKRLDHPSIVKYQGMTLDHEYLSIVLE